MAFTALSIPPDSPDFLYAFGLAGLIVFNFGKHRESIASSFLNLLNIDTKITLALFFLI